MISSRHTSWASLADCVLPATGPVSDRQYPTRMGGSAAGMSGAGANSASEKLQFRGQGGTARFALLDNDAREAGGFIRPMGPGTLLIGHLGLPESLTPGGACHRTLLRAHSPSRTGKWCHADLWEALFDSANVSSNLLPDRDGSGGAVQRSRWAIWCSVASAVQASRDAGRAGRAGRTGRARGDSLNG